MGNLTNLTGEALSVPHLERAVDPGETVVVADYLLAERVWPAATWRVDGSDTVQLVGDAYRVPDPPPEEPAEAVPAPDAPVNDEGE